MKKLLVLALLGVAASLSACADVSPQATPVAAAPAPVAATPAKKVIKPSKAVAKAQTALKAAGFDPGPIDGVTGKKTRAAVSAFQKAKNIPVTGRLDKATAAALKV